MTKIAGILFLFSGVCFSAQAAEENSTRVSTEQLKINKEYKDSATLTDIKLRAEDGSLSKYSFKMSLGYNGPTLNDWSQKDQPNIDGTVGNYSTNISGSFGLKYRTSADRSFSLSSGIKFNHPFHGLDRTDINDPSLSYEMSDRFGELQMRNIPSIGYVTTPAYTKVGEVASAGFKNSLVYRPSESNISYGFDTSISYYFYEREYQAKDGKAAQSYLTFVPNLKYSLNEKLALNTAWTVYFWNPRSEKDQTVLWNRTVGQSVGLGYAYRRDIYISPYLKFYPTRMAIDATTINVDTIFSIF